MIYTYSQIARKTDGGMDEMMPESGNLAHDNRMIPGQPRGTLNLLSQHMMASASICASDAAPSNINMC